MFAQASAQSKAAKNQKMALHLYESPIITLTEGGVVRTLPLAIVSLSLASCASQTQYIRADGNPTTKEQITIDEEACNANPQDQYCMIEKGYFLIATDKAAEKNAQLFTIVAQNRRQAELAAKAA